MLWVMFDESDRRIPAPDFCLFSTKCKQVCLRDYHEDCNLVLFFAHSQDCAACRRFLKDVTGRMVDYQDQEARIVAIIPSTVEQLKADVDLNREPITLLADPDQNVYRRYAGTMAASLVPTGADMIFVLDRYGAPYAALVGSDLEKAVTDESIQNDILSWLQFIGLQCPE